MRVEMKSLWRDLRMGKTEREGENLMRLTMKVSFRRRILWVTVGRNEGEWETLVWVEIKGKLRFGSKCRGGGRFCRSTIHLGIFL